MLKKLSLKRQTCTFCRIYGVSAVFLKLWQHHLLLMQRQTDLDQSRPSSVSHVLTEPWWKRLAFWPHNKNVVLRSSRSFEGQFLQGSVFRELSSWDEQRGDNEPLRSAGHGRRWLSGTTSRLVFLLSCAAHFDGWTLTCFLESQIQKIRTFHLSKWSVFLFFLNSVQFFLEVW